MQNPEQLTDSLGGVWLRGVDGWHFWQVYTNSYSDTYSQNLMEYFGPLTSTTDEDRKRVGLE